MSSDASYHSLLTLLDLSAAFDTVDHTILLEYLQAISHSASAQSWFKSYIPDRSRVQLNG